VATKQSRLEDMVTKTFWKNRRVLITGHTGFKGSWLSLWLQLLGADVIGYSLPPPTAPGLYELCRVGDGMISIQGDVRDFVHLKKVIETYHPDLVIHMAAQALVRRAYQDPVETFSTNVMGTVHLLEAVRQAGGVRAIVNVTSDKCYENKEWVWGYRETDSMGGSDPYSSSKGCAELIASSYINSFFGPRLPDENGVALASVRAGNAIGGGDWAEDRLIPDIMRALLEKQVVRIRYLHAIRPWQHVLEPLSGYLILAERLYQRGIGYAEAWNFGPNGHEARSVSWIVENITRLWGRDASWKVDEVNQPHEAHYLKLDSSKARLRLGWKPQLNIEEAIEWTVAWYKAYQKDPSSMSEITKSQINDYNRLLKK
jgi:CDP-glucose 4,6-dehydratase